jgi:hypothetical protein
MSAWGATAKSTLTLIDWQNRILGHKSAVFLTTIRYIGASDLHSCLLLTGSGEHTVEGLLLKEVDK